MTSWQVAEARYDAWRTAAPSEPRYGWAEFEEYVGDNPECGWDPNDEGDLTEFIDMMERDAAEAKADAAIDRIEADRADDDRDYWGGL